MSAALTTKTEWLDRIEQARTTWEELVDQALKTDVNRPGATGDWTFKDVGAHLNDWREWTVIRLEAAVDGVAPVPPWPDNLSEETEAGVQAINDWFYARDQSRSLDEILAETRGQFRRLRAAVEL